MKYTKLVIQNFRGIQTLEIKDFKQVNLLAGRNNCGKTSVLEALFLISGMANPQLPVTINFFRDLGLAKDEAFDCLFYKLDFNRLPRIEAIVQEVTEKPPKQRTLTIAPLYANYLLSLEQKELKKKDLGQLSDQSFNITTSTLQLIEGIRLDFSEDQYTGHAEAHLEDQKFIFQDGYKESLRCAFLSTKTAMSQLDRRLEQLLVQKNLDKIILVLKEIEPSLSDIRMGVNGMIYVDIGLDKLLPLSLMGDGTRRLLAILSAVFDMKNGILLLDEIENGFHYSSLKTLWKAIGRAAQEFNVQIFATTHSYECIEAFAKSGYPEICFCRIDRTATKHQAFAYSTEVLRAGLEKAFEVR
jgi:predicted ATP-dependent endonuclease of OLD family